MAKYLNTGFFYRPGGKPKDLYGEMRQNNKPDLGFRKHTVDIVLENKTLAKKQSPRTLVLNILYLVKHCQLEDAKELVRGRKKELTDWMSNGTYDANKAAKFMESEARRNCHMVPKNAKFLIEIIAQAGLVKSLKNIAKSSSDEIASMAEIEIAKMNGKKQ